MFPHDEDGRAMIRRFPQLVFEAVDFAKAEFCIDRQAAANGGRLDGGEGAHIKISDTIFLLIDFVGGIGSENELGGTVFSEQHGRQGEGAIEAAAVQLPKRCGRFFTMPDADDDFRLRGGGGRNR